MSVLMVCLELFSYILLCGFSVALWFIYLFGRSKEVENVTFVK